jgi:hypothetical protein
VEAGISVGGALFPVVAIWKVNVWRYVLWSLPGLRWGFMKTGVRPTETWGNIQNRGHQRSYIIHITSLDMKAPLSLGTKLDAGSGIRPICLFMRCFLETDSHSDHVSCHIKLFIAFVNFTTFYAEVMNASYSEWQIGISLSDHPLSLTM